MRNISVVSKFQLAANAKHDLKILPKYYDDVMMEKKGEKYEGRDVDVMPKALFE